MFDLIEKEKSRQWRSLELIASEVSCLVENPASKSFDGHVGLRVSTEQIQSCFAVGAFDALTFATHHIHE